MRFVITVEFKHNLNPLFTLKTEKIKERLRVAFKGMITNGLGMYFVNHFRV